MASPTIQTLTSFSGADLVATFANKVIGELQHGQYKEIRLLYLLVVLLMHVLSQEENVVWQAQWYLQYLTMMH